MGTQDVNIVFLAVVIVLAVYGFRGYREGFIRTVFRMFSLFVALVAGIVLGKELGTKVVVFFVTWILLWYLCFTLDIISKLPILNGINRVAGFLGGLLRGVMAVWIWGIVLMLFMEAPVGEWVYGQVESNGFLRLIFENNLFYQIGSIFVSL